jgi:preprotein translocase subunit SecE
MAEALKVKEDGIRGGSGGGGNAVASALGKFGEYPRRVRSFLHDVRLEMKQVNWPSREDVTSTTVVVIVTVAFFGVYFLLADTVCSKAITFLINYAKH